MGTVYKCRDCGNLHGAVVAVCGMCGSGNVGSVDPDAPPLPRGVAETKIEHLIDALIQLAETATAYIETQLLPEADEEDESQDEGAPLHHAGGS